ncbi:MAG: hypothetical protein V1815_03220 [Candidatus Woesearchaeota archaeon]
MNKKSIYRIISWSTLGGAIANTFNAIHNKNLYDITQQVLKESYNAYNVPKILVKVSNINNNFDFAQWSNYLSQQIQRTSYIEIGSALLLAGISYHFHKKFKKLDNWEDHLSLDIDHI